MVDKYKEIFDIIDELDNEIGSLESYLPEEDIGSRADWDLALVRFRVRKVKEAFSSFVDSKKNKRLKKNLGE